MCFKLVIAKCATEQFKFVIKLPAQTQALNQHLVGAENEIQLEFHDGLFLL